MFDKRILKYFDKIQHGKAFNYNVFLSLLPEDLQEEVRDKALVTFQKKSSAIVELSCENIIERIRQLTIEPKDRVAATLQGDSHKIKTSTSYLFVYHQLSNDVTPDTIVCVKNAAHFKFQPKKHLIIIENSELFFAKDFLLSKMNEAFSMSLSFENTDLVFGSGNQIANSYNQCFLTQYDTVLCFFDYDYGGLQIYKALKNMVGDKAKFLEPTSDNLDNFFIKKPKDDNQYLKTIDIAEELGLEKLKEIFLSQKGFMEQEAILAFNKEINNVSAI